MKSTGHDTEFFALRRFTVALTVVWVLLIAAALAWNLYHLRRYSREMAENEARATFNKDLAFRLWATKHGGVYVPVTEETPANPYLTGIAERDIVTHSGKRLTLMNPAYMLRQVMGTYAVLYGVKGHLTSLKTLNPINRPDAWEAEVLKAFEQGTQEVGQLMELRGEPYLRYMHSLRAEKGCLKCHGQQGYKEGDVRGGLGIDVPMRRYLDIETERVRRAVVSYLLLLLSGLGGIWFIHHKGRQHILALREAELERKLLQTEEIARHWAEEANQAKSDFLANMSHELRTPLNSVIGFTEILQDQLFGPLNAKQLEYLRDIEGSGRHLLSLLNDILDLAKVESGKQELHPGAVAVGDLLAGALALFKEKALKHGIKLELNMAPEAEREIEGDERKLKQIMFNLLSNAVKFTPDGGRVSVKARLLPKPPDGLAAGRGDFLEIAVVDSGIGIRPGDLDKLFKPFSQLEAVYTKEYEGTGLGLALSRQLVELHGGRIGVTSEFGKGSAFSFILPLKQAGKSGR